MSTVTLNLVAGLLRGRLKEDPLAVAKPPAGKIATIVLAMLRHDQRLADMAGGKH